MKRSLYRLDGAGDADAGEDDGNGGEGAELVDKGGRGEFQGE